MCTVCSLAPEPEFEFSVYIVPENDPSVPLCINVNIEVREPTTYTIVAIQKDPPEADGIYYKIIPKNLTEVICTIFYTDADFGTTAAITVNPSSTRACIDFTDLVVDDNIGREGNEAFTILVGGSMAMVTIIDDDG